MTGLLLQIGATKLAVSVVLACVVWMIHRRVRSPAVSYPLWLLVLVTLLVPAVVSLPVLPVPSVVPAVLATAPGAPASAPAVLFAEVAADAAAGPRFGAILGSGLAILWLVGTAGLLAWTAVRVIRFRRTLARVLRPAPAWLQRQAAEIGRDLGLSRIPELHVADARVTPMVWWAGGRVRVLIPALLLTGMGSGELRAILAHELAHVRRRDHLVRWLEWLACTVFWWNPVAWWARQRLQVAEEACCDQLAVGAGGSCRKTYANALLRVVASTSEPPGLRPLLPASAASGAGRTKPLERRIRMIVSADTRSPAPRWLRTTGRLALLCALPLGLIYCDWATAVDEETAMDPVEAQPVGVDELGAVVDELGATTDELSAAAAAALRAIFRAEAEYQDLIREGIDIPDEVGRKYVELLVTGMVERNRGLWTGDYSSRISTADLDNPQLRATLDAFEVLMKGVVDDPDVQERVGELNDRIQELRTRVREAIGRVPLPEVRKE